MKAIIIMAEETFLVLRGNPSSDEGYIGSGEKEKGEREVTLTSTQVTTQYETKHIQQVTPEKVKMSIGTLNTLLHIQF